MNIVKNLPSRFGLLMTAICLLHAVVSLAQTPPTLLQLAFPDVPTGELGGRQLQDYSPLSLDYARTWGNPNGVEVVFTASVDPATATNTANYALTPGITVLGAAMGSNASSVILTTTTMTNGVLHTLAATNIFDASLQYSILPTLLPLLEAQGVITRKLFTGISGAAVSNLTGAAKFPNAPDAVDWPAAFEAMPNAADNYGLQFAGYVYPPATGDYVFFIAADDQAALYLSSDANPANKALLANVPSHTAARTYTTYTNQRSAYVRLEAGRAYYVEALLKEAAGDDHLAVAWRLRGMSVPATGDAPIPGAFLSSLTRSAPVSITAQPQSQTVAERAPAAFAVVPTGTPPYTYQWLRNGAPIPGATATNYTIASTPTNLSGSAFVVVVANAFSSITSSPAVLTVTADTNPPIIVRLDGSATLDRVTVSFSEPVTTVSANNSANYAFTGGLTVLDARLQSSGTNVVLLTSPQAPGVAYTLTATGVADTAARHNTKPTTASFTAWSLTRGFLRREVFTGIGSNSVLADLVNNPKFPDSPDEVSFVTQFESPVNVADNYGQRLLGQLLPPLTGFYVFYIACNDQGALYLSPDANAENKTLIASVPSYTSLREWDLFASQQSAPVWLVAGQSYYVEAQMQEGTGGDFVSVAWQLPGGSTPTNGAAPIPGTYLAICANPAGTSLVVTQQPASVTVLESNPTNFTVGVTASYTPAFYQWQKNGVDIPGANATTYTTPRLFRTDNLARYRCFVSIPGTNRVSAEAVLTVTPDNTPPQALSAATLTGSDTVGLGFTELLDTTTATNTANYTLSTGGQVLRATLRPDGQAVALTVATLSFTNFTVTVKGVKDLSGNTIPTTLLSVGVVPLEAQDIGITGDPLEPGSTFSFATNALDVVAGGSDIAYNHDGFHFDYGQCEGDFDARVRVARLDLQSTYTKAGLMVRESLLPGSRMLVAFVYPTNGANGYKAHYRAQQDAAAVVWPGSSLSAGAPIPNAWIRLTRVGTTFTAFRGTNGSKWTQFAQLSTTNFPNRVFVGAAASAVSNSLSHATTAWFRNYSATGTVVPPTPFDLLIKKAADPVASYSLDGIYQTTPHGAQSLWQTATSNAPAAFHVQVQNDGTNTLSPIVNAIETAETGWNVTYRVAGQDITAQICSTNGYTVTNLVAGTPETIIVEFLPGSRVLGGTPKSATLSVFPDSYTTSLRDTVKATAIYEPTHQADLMVRRLTDVIYRGKGVFNADGTGQNKFLELDYGMTGVYPIQLLNAGNVTNFFTLRGAAGGAGWTVRYLDSVSAGADITGDMTGGGTIVALPPAASWEGRVEVTFDATVPRGASNTVLVTASAIGGQATDSDTVKIITAVITTSDIALAGLYTSDADFEKGTLAGLAYGNNQLQLSSEISVLPFIWVPNSNEGTVSKVDTRTGRELGRYRTCPASVNGQPSRTTIDQFGNCWVANRQSGTVVKIGLMENGQYLDRNGNGVVDTSQDTNGDGDITGAELLPWGKDECVLYEVILIPGKEGTYSPGTYAGGYVDNYWNPGPRGIAVDYAGNVWAGTHDAMKYYYLDGTSAAILRTNDTAAFGHMPYGAVIDANGILWSSGYRESGQNSVLRLDPRDNSMSAINFEFHTYGLGLDRSNHLFVAGHQESKLSRINVLSGTREWTVNAGYLSRGVTCTDDGDVWVASSSEGTIWRFSNDGVYKTKIAVGTTPTGVSVDAAGKVWVVNDGDENIVRLDPAIGAGGAIDLTKRIIGGLHYGYSDMTGIISRNTTTRFGTWTVRHNSKLEFTSWSAVTWHGTNLVVTNIAGDVTNVFANCNVRVRSSSDLQQWSGWERAVNGYPLSATPAGQYLELEVTLQQLSPEGSPVLYDISITPVPQGSADLVVTQTITPDPVTQWLPATNWITVSNLGPDQATGVVLSNVLPAGVEFVSATATQGTAALQAGAIRCVLGTLAAGYNATVAVVFIPTNTATVASVVSVKAYDFDPQPQGNVVVGSTTVAPLTCAPVPAGLVAWWPGEGSGIDLVGTNTATLQNGATYGNGKVSSAFAYNGANQFAQVPNSAALHSDRQVTVVGWFMANRMTNQWQNIFWKGNSPDNTGGVNYDNREYVLWLNSSGFLQFGSTPVNRIGTGQLGTNSPNLVTSNVWYHFAAVVNSDQNHMRLYLNAQLVVEAPYSTANIRTTTGPLVSGSAPGRTYHLNGLVDELAIYNRALSLVEVRAIYFAGSSGLCRTSFLPVLTTQPAGTSAVLSWTATAPWTLQSTPALMPGVVWSNVPGTPFVLTNRYWQTNPITTPSRYYRLTR